MVPPLHEGAARIRPRTPLLPDANLTLRVAYGHVGGYEYADGEYHKPQTTLDGIIAKDNPEIYDYDIPQALRELYATKDYGRWATTIDGRRTVPVCFLATNHTTGGNSGSPIINGRANWWAEFRPHMALDDERRGVRRNDLPQHRRRRPIRAVRHRPHRRGGIPVRRNGFQPPQIGAIHEKKHYI